MDADLIEWADKIDQASTVEEMIAIIEQMPPDVAARWAELMHPTYCSTEPVTTVQPPASTRETGDDPAGK